MFESVEYVGTVMSFFGVFVFEGFVCSLGLCLKFVVVFLLVLFRLRFVLLV